jgi:serine/threonine protein kinase
LLEGESLHGPLACGVPPQRKAIDYAVQIAQGLAAAHSKDIAHRDLKPDNIFITRQGGVKILDFGLAKSVQKPARSHDPTVATMASASPPTEQGVVVGTAGYMSPEQIRGAAVDCRTDIFSFGAVLYEMLTGKRAFKAIPRINGKPTHGVEVGESQAVITKLQNGGPEFARSPSTRLCPESRSRPRGAIRSLQIWLAAKPNAARDK